MHKELSKMVDEEYGPQSRTSAFIRWMQWTAMVPVKRVSG